MNIVVFCYNFHHYKTQIGIQNLLFHGYKPKLVIAADPVELKFYKSKIRVAPKDLYLFHPKDICERNQIQYVVAKHNSQQTSDLILENQGDIGIILGARILKDYIIEKFNIGIINAHPGLLPENRGLDTLKWSIIKQMPQGVTTHLIDSNIDRGRLLHREEIKVYKDDSLVDLHIRLLNKEQEMLIHSLRLLTSDVSINDLSILPTGKNYHRSVPPEIEEKLQDLFEKYKKNIGV